MRRTPGLTRSLFLLLLAAMLIAWRPAAATEIPWRPGDIDVTANNEPLTAFIIRMLTRQRLAASVSEAVGMEAVNGRFRGRPEVVFRELVETYGLTWYYDGSVVHVTSLSENRSRLLSVRPGQVERIDKVLREMRVVDPRYPLRSSRADGYIFVSGPPRMIELASEAVSLLAEVSDVSEGTTRVFRLKYAWASDTKVIVGGVETEVPGVASILSEMLGDGGKVVGRQQRQVSPRQSGLRGRGLASVGASEVQSASGAASGASGAAAAVPSVSASPAGAPSDGISSGAAGSAGPQRSVANRSLNGGASSPETRTPSPVIIRADPRLNAVIVRDVADRMSMYEELIASLDRPSALVEVEATVIDVSTDTSQTLGIDWRGHTRHVDIASSPNGLAGPGGINRNSANDLVFTDNPLSAGGGLVGTLLFGSQRSYFLARINALSQEGEANLVSRPRVLTLDNNEAVLQSTQEFYVRVQGKDAVDLYNVSTGLVMRVTPTLVEEDGKRLFKLLVRIEDGNRSTTAQVDQIPLVSRNSIVTQAMVGEGESLLLGGYVIDESQKGENGVPFLSKIPGVGALFRQDSKSSRRFERIFMITPRLVSRPQGVSQ
jgi:type III secretion protein C